MQIKIELRVTFETAFNLGSDVKASTFADRPLRKDKNGWPFVPATSLRGRLRHCIERMANGLKLQPSPCIPPLADSMCQTDIVSQICPVCQIFGAPWHPSPIRFTDLVLVEPGWLAQQREKREMAPSTDLRYGVALSRRRRVAEDALLYTTELFVSGLPLTFKGDINGDLTTAQLALLFYGLKSLSNLGRGKTSGLGWCRIKADPQALLEDGQWQPVSQKKLTQEFKKWPTSG